MLARGARGDQLPTWVKKWTEGLQFVFLGASIATFSVGLVTYTYSTSEKVSSIVEGFAAFSNVHVSDFIHPFYYSVLFWYHFYWGDQRPGLDDW
jgi:hypothetical protein